jgi:hypothetical protein
MLANEARKLASEKIWNSLPGIIRYNIEDAVNEGRLNCEIIFNDDRMDKAKFDDCIGYFNNLNNLGYETAMHKELGKYVITIMW